MQAGETDGDEFNNRITPGRAGWSRRPMAMKI